MAKLRFSLNIPATEYKRYYSGAAGSVLTVADNGQQLQFPAAELRRYVSRSGVHGRFEIEFDERNKLIRLDRLAK